MPILSQIKALLRMELLMEMRSLHALGGIVIYLVSSVFVLYSSFLIIGDPDVWNALFWIIILFVSVNSTARTFLQEPEGRWLYIYQLISPRGLILGRIAYQTAFLILMGFTVFGLFSVLLGNPVTETGTFCLVVLISSAGFASAFTLMSAIAGRAGQSTTLVAILGFPVILPLLVTTLKISSACLESSLVSPDAVYLLVLLLIDALIIALSYILFPYLWAE